MNFFKSVFADDEPLSESEHLSSEPDPNHDDSGSDPESDSEPNTNLDATESAPVVGSGWDFGGLIKTLATKSESVIDTYKRDLQEFSTGLKAETAVFREVANRAVKELPKAGVSTFDELKTTVLRGTTQIITQGKEALLSLDQENSSPVAKSGDRSFNYNRFDARLRAIQIDKDTYCGEPEDLEDYEKWKSGFVIEEKGEELGMLFEENGAMENIYHKIVPSEIDPETFWYRYFYKVYKLKQAEEVRASFLKKAIDDDEEELSWDVDEDEADSDGESAVVMKNARKLDESESGKVSSPSEVKKDADNEGEQSNEIAKVADNDNVVKQESQVVDSGKIEEKVDGRSDVSETEKEKEMVEEKVDEKRDATDTGKAVEKVEDTVSKENKPAPQLEKEVMEKTDDSTAKAEPGTTTDEDLEWDEIEDEGSDGEKPIAPRLSHDKAELQKRLSSTVEEEDLSWDIEDDDEPVKY